MLLAAALPLLHRYGYPALPVHYLGKAATFNLLYAFPLLLLAQWDGAIGTLASALGWAFAWWGVGLYWYAALLYFGQARSLLRHQVRA